MVMMFLKMSSFLKSYPKIRLCPINQIKSLPFSTAFALAACPHASNLTFSIFSTAVSTAVLMQSILCQPYIFTKQPR